MATLEPINIREVERRRDAIVQQALSPYYEQPVDPDRLTRSILELLPNWITYDQMFESVRYLAGRRLVELDAIKLAWRLAGNINTFRNGKPVTPWVVQQADEWVPLQILKLHRVCNSKNKIGYDVVSRVMAGTPAPLRVDSFWGSRAVRYVASKLGFSRPWQKYPFTNAHQLVGLRFYGLLEVARSRGRPEFHEIECPPPLLKWNRENILKLRLRVGRQCPLNYNHACHVCAVGYDQCQAATHPKTYVIDHCAGCNKSDVPFDPDDPYPHCVHCASLARLRRKDT